ncbi:hypothetical protein [Candidatus Parabeggiatoa sp. HSG14]|uniref:DUF7024 domain-containing protein n=1 Tax=Candidatus Parabeggiatoa sp. HSG14 TaxID=3055593 RepID=UPI0025A7514E|nr:hypothetical protein [Thiotrichales bacterium HSG14]
MFELKKLKFDVYEKSYVSILCVCAAFVAFYAAFSFRGYYADGAYHIFMMMDNGGFFFYELSRLVATFLHQLPTFLAFKIGIKDISILSFIFSLTLELLPLVLTIFSYFVLPKEKKSYFIFPLIYYFFGAQASGFTPIAEGATATAYFWVLFNFVLFKKFDDRNALLFLLICIPALLLHQVWLFLGIIMIVASYWRLTKERNQLVRIILSILIAWFVVIIIVQLYFVIYPRDIANRESYITNFFNFTWLASSNGLNLPATLGLLLFFIVTVWLGAKRILKGNHKRNLEFVLLISAVVCVAVGVGATVAEINGFVASTNFNARNHGAFISFPLALISFMFVYGLFNPILMKQIFLKRLISILAVGALLWHVVGIGLWNNYLASFKMMLDSKQGLLVWEQATKQLSSAERLNLSVFQWSWTVPAMSYLLSKKGKVRTIITNPSIPVWQPFDPRIVSSLPRNKFFDPSHYIQVLNAESGIIFFDLLTDSMPPCIKSIEGMSYNEGWAKWTHSDSVHINFIRTLPESFDLILDVAAVFGPNVNQPFKVIVGNSIQEFKPVDGKPSLVRLHFENLDSSDRITLIVPKPTSPLEYLGTSDKRLLGIALKSFSIALTN